MRLTRHPTRENRSRMRLTPRPTVARRSPLRPSPRLPWRPSRIRRRGPSPATASRRSCRSRASRCWRCSPRARAFAGRTPSQAGGGASPRKRRVPYLPMLGGFAAAMIGGAAAFVGSSNWGDQGGTASLRSSGDDGTKHFVPQLGGPLEAPVPLRAPVDLLLLDRVASMAPRPSTGSRAAGCGSGSPRRPSGDPPGYSAWCCAAATGSPSRPPSSATESSPGCRPERARLDCVTWSMHADLSRRMLVVQRDDQTVRRFRIAIGRRQNPTPRGRFSVTDKLRVTDSGSPYGCCVLALSGHQTHLPRGLARRGPARHPCHHGAHRASASRRAWAACASPRLRRAG